MRKNTEIKIFSKPGDLFHRAALEFAERAIAAVKIKGIFTVVLSGGETAKSFYNTLVEFHEKEIPWAYIHFFFGDERYLPADDPANNYQIAHHYLFSKTTVPKENIHPIPTTFLDPKKAASTYELTLRDFFHLNESNFPVFDLLYLGLGENAHTASLMPGSDVVKNSYTTESHELVVSLWVPELNMYRITLTPSAINNSECIVFLVTGKNKSSAVWNVLEGPMLPEQYPAQLIHCLHGKTIWYLDSAAAEKLEGKLTYVQ